MLQHVPKAELIENYVRELVRITSPGGIALLQAPHSIPMAYRLQPIRRLYELLRRFGVPAQVLILRTPIQPMRMTALPRERFEAAVVAAGGTILGVEPSGPHAFRYAIGGPVAPVASDIPTVSGRRSSRSSVAGSDPRELVETSEPEERPREFE